MSDAQKTTEQSPVGWVFVELTVRLQKANRSRDFDRMKALGSILAGLETEFPVEFAAEEARVRG